MSNFKEFISENRFSDSDFDATKGAGGLMGQAFSMMAKDQASMEPKKFKIGDPVHIHNPDYRGEMGTVADFSINTFSRPLIDVKLLSGGSPCFYPSELSLATPQEWEEYQVRMKERGW